MKSFAIRALLAALLLSVALVPSAAADHTGAKSILGGFSGGVFATPHLDHVIGGCSTNRICDYSFATGNTTSSTTTGPATVNAISADGTRTIFSTATSLSPLDTDTQTDVYEYSGGVFTLRSLGSSGGNGATPVEFRGANEDASHVYFTTTEKLVAADTDAASDLYQNFAGNTTILSLGPFGGNSTGITYFGGSSADGSHVFFGTSDQLTADDLDARTDTYDNFNGTLTRISTGPIGGQGPFGVAYAGNTPDGSTVFFQTKEQLTVDDTDDDNRDTYSRTAGVTRLESTGPLPSAATIATFKGASLDGSKVFFVTEEPLLPEDQDIYNDVYQRSGGTTTLLSQGPVSASGPNSAIWSGMSEDGSRVFFSTDEQLVAEDTDGSRDIYEASGGTVSLVSTGPTDPRGLPSATYWGNSADGQRVFFSTTEPMVAADPNSTSIDLYERFGGVTYLVRPPGASQLDNRAVAAVSRNGERLLITGNGSFQIWYVREYARPQGATPTRVPLVPAFAECTSPNLVHGPALEFGSCGPPQQTSPNLTVGTPDANAAAANSSGSISLTVMVGAPGPPNDSDVAIHVDMSDVRCAGAGTGCGSANATGGPDYTGELSAVAPLQITDQDYPGDSTATTQASEFPVTVPCSTSAATDRGGDCAVSTTANAVVPGAITDGNRAIWQLGQLRVDDGGPDGDADTTGDNSPFAKQGLFVP
jgi:hypothetical protein